jgi:hypothetical protein
MLAGVASDHVAMAGEQQSTTHVIILANLPVGECWNVSGRSSFDIRLVAISRQAKTDWAISIRTHVRSALSGYCGLGSFLG